MIKISFLRQIIFSFLVIGHANSVIITAETANDHVGAEFSTKATTDKIPEGIKSTSISEKIISLQGNWNCKLDSENVGLSKKWPSTLLEETTPITLPGTLATAKIGPLNSDRSRFGLTPEIKNTSIAWYQREITIPEEWAGKVITIYLDRCGWESRLWVDDQAIGIRDTLSTAHVYDISNGIAPGKRLLTIRLNSSGRPGVSCHGWGMDTQMPWNGILGKMEISAHDPIRIGRVEIDARKKGENGEAKISAIVENFTNKSLDGLLKFKIRRKGEVNFIPVGEAAYKSGTPEMTISVRTPIEKEFKLWDEFNPNLYELKVENVAEGEGLKASDVKLITFGVREIKTEKGTLYFNNQKTFLRGTHDGCAFPMTGAMSTDVDEWIKIFKIIKSYGLNHVRYHSVCPPDAAFTAADEVGIYLQAELPFWGQVKMGWSGSAFLRTELDRIIEAYGNHPSFCFMSMGNEHDGDWGMLEDFVIHGKRKDPRHLCIGTSNAYIYPGSKTGFPAMPEDQFWVSMLGGVPKNGERKRIRYMERFTANELVDRAGNYSDLFENNQIPGISHELGQFAFFPNLNEISKYTGLMKARNFELFKESLIHSGLITQWEDFFKSSGASALELYKEEIERIMRTPECAGYQLLDLHDYPGQGTALVGILDVFWESKGLITPENFKKFCDKTILLSEIKKTWWDISEKVSVPILISHYGAENLSNVQVDWTVKSDMGFIINKGSLPVMESIKRGSLEKIGTINFETTSLKEATEIVIEAKIKGTSISNDWKLWCGNEKPTPLIIDENVVMTEVWNDKVINQLRLGGRVLFLGHKSIAAMHIDACNSLWTPWNSIPTMGMLIQQKHSALKKFPTRYHTDWQWWDTLEPFAQSFVIPGSAGDFRPIVQPIDQPMRNLRLGAIVEAKIGTGLLLATSLNIVDDLDKRPGARQLRESLFSYIKSTEFSPKSTLTLEQAEQMVANPRFSESETAPVTTEDNVILNIEASVNVPENSIIAWKKINDKIITQKEGADWNWDIAASNRWGGIPKISTHKFGQLGWMTNAERIYLTVPNAFSGDLYFMIRDRSNGKRRGQIEISREMVNMGTQTENGKWIRIKIYPSDIQSGKVTLTMGRMTGIDSLSTSPIIEKLVLVRKRQ